MNMISRLKWGISLGLLLIASCLFVNRSTAADVQVAFPCYHPHMIQLEDCASMSTISSLARTASQSDRQVAQAKAQPTNQLRGVSDKRLFATIANLGEANLPSTLAKITIPCTRDCSKTCDICKYNICIVEPICYTNCQVEAHDCWLLVDLYKSYMSGYIQSGVTYYELSPQFKNALAPYLEIAIGKTRTELDQITIGTSGNAYDGNAMTDCNKITWPNSPTGNQIEHALSGANRNESDILLAENLVHWVYHEFVHTFQCDELGGRTEFAYNWWKELPPALLAANADPRQIHAHQPSEQNADSRGYDILNIMPMLVPRYVTGMQALGTQLSGSTINFVSTAMNVLTSQSLGSVNFKDKPQFVVVDENNNTIVTLAAFPVPGESTYGTTPVFYVKGKFSASWTIPANLEGQTLYYKFEIRDNNDYLMDESSAQSFAIVKRYIYVNTNYTGGSEDGSKAKPYRTIQAALSDPDISKVISIRVAGGTYAALPINTRVIVESDGSGLVTIR